MGTAIPCPVHCHPCGGARLVEAKGSMLGAGTAMPCLVAPPPLGRCPPGLGKAQLESGWSSDVMVYTAMARTVHRLVLSDATTMLFLEASVFGVELRESPRWEPPPYVWFTALLIQRGRKTDMGTIGGTATLLW